MTKPELNKVARKLQSELQAVRKNERITLADVKLVIDCCLSGDYSRAFESRFYNKQGGAYCELLGICYSHGIHI